MTADEWHPPAEKRCGATKAKVPRLRSASAVDEMMARRTLVAIRKEFDEDRPPYNCCARREAS